MYELMCDDSLYEQLYGMDDRHMALLVKLNKQ